MSVHVNHPFQLEGPKNLRELGGYPAKAGKYTRCHVFLRSDALNELTDTGEQFLFDYGLRLVVDLRNRLVRLAEPDHIDRHDIRDVSVPLYDHIFGSLVLDDLHLKDGHTELTMEEVYCVTVDRGQEQIRKVLSDLIACSDCALFHCTAGKDRTGIIAMLLLKMAGVPEDVIVADYAESASNESGELRREEELAEHVADALVPEGMFTSDPEVMEKLLFHLRERYGSVEEYLAGSVGITQKQWDELNAKFLTDEAPGGKNAG